MTIRFAPAVDRVPGGLAGMRCPPPANDNPSFGEVVLPREALLHFAEHGLGSAAAARARAEQAFFAGDRETYRHWLGICRTFDRRLARWLDGRVGDTSR